MSARTRRDRDERAMIAASTLRSRAARAGIGRHRRVQADVAEPAPGRATYWMRPPTMPTATAPNPKCQHRFGSMPWLDEEAAERLALREVAARRSARRRADVDAHVVDREAGVAADVLRE